MEAVVNIILCLFIYSFLGWCCETLYCSFGAGKFINRGFLNGPFCPIYGFGALATIGILQFIPDHVFSVFFGGMIITSAIEYFTSWIMEKLFSARWWDYSTYRFNINGRVCLLNSTLFGLMCLLLKFDVHPVVDKLLGAVSADFKMGFAAALLIYFAADIAITVRSVLGLNKRISRIWKLRSELQEARVAINEQLQTLQKVGAYEAREAKEASEERLRELKDRINQRSAQHKRLLNAFPQFSSLKSNEAIAEIKKAAEAASKAYKAQKENRKNGK